MALQGAGPFARSSNLTAAETSLQSAIDAILAQLPALTTGGSSNLINAQAWPAETDSAISVAAEVNGLIAAALAAFSTTAEVNGLIAAELAEYSTAAGVNSLIATVLTDYSTAAQVNGLIATAVGGIGLSNYYETYSQAEVDSVVSSAIDALNIAQYRAETQVSQAISDALVPYYTSAEVDSAIAGQSGDLSDYYPEAPIFLKLNIA